MNITTDNKEYRRPYPDTSSVPSELSLTDAWDGLAISGLIRSKSENGETPAFLYLGKKEIHLLGKHLAEVFGEEAVANLHGTYYMGLHVVSVDCDSFLSTGGRKTNQAFIDMQSRRPTWQDVDSGGQWQMRI